MIEVEYDERQEFIDHAVRHGFNRLRVITDVQGVENLKGIAEPVLVQGPRGLKGPVYGIKWDNENQDVLAAVTSLEENSVYSWKVKL